VFAFFGSEALLPDGERDTPGLEEGMARAAIHVSAGTRTWGVSLLSTTERAKLDPASRKVISSGPASA
jgi:hypothetical protein